MKGELLEELIAVFSDSLAVGADPATLSKPAVGKEQMRDGLLANWSVNYYSIDLLIAEGNQGAAIGSTCWTCKGMGKKG